LYRNKNKQQMRQLFIAASLLLSLYATAQNKSEENLFRQSVETLASDEFGGRKPFTKYEQKTIDFKVKEHNGDIHDIKTYEGSSFAQNTNTNDSLFKFILSRGGEIKFTAIVKEYGNEI